MGNNFLVPHKPLFAQATEKEKENLMLTNVSTIPMLKLLATPLAHVDISNIPELAEFAERYRDLDGMTIGDLINLQQVIKAAEGNTQAYSAINKSTANLGEITAKMEKLNVYDKLTDTLFAAVEKARQENPTKTEDEDMFGSRETIIDVDLSNCEEDE